MLNEKNALVSKPHIVIPDEYWEHIETYWYGDNQKTLVSRENYQSCRNTTQRESLRLGEILHQADLVSPQQIQVALGDQKQYSHLKIGEILVLHGWVSEKTVEFFAQQWSDLLNQAKSYTIGYYLKEASLLSEQQIQRILAEQKRMNLRFGELAVLDGFLSQKTRDFFLEHLTSNIAQNPSERSIRPPSKNQQKNLANESTIAILNDIRNRFSENTTEIEATEEIDLENIPWLG
jgi:hypothetical protein